MSASHPTESRTAIDSVSLLIGGYRVPIWFGLAIEEMCTETGVTITDVTVTTSPESSGNDISEFRKQTLITLQDAVILSELDREIDIRLLPSVSEQVISQARVYPTNRGGIALSDQATERIAIQADIVVHHGVGILKGEILQCPEFGVLGYHHGDIREYRGPGYGFWEFMEEEQKSGVTLQLLNEELDEGKVVEISSVDISDTYTLSDVRRRLNIASVPLLAEGIKRLLDPSFSPKKLSDDELGEMYYYADATLSVKLRYAVKEGVARLREKMK